MLQLVTLLLFLLFDAVSDVVIAVVVSYVAFDLKLLLLYVSLLCSYSGLQYFFIYFAYMRDLLLNILLPQVVIKTKIGMGIIEPMKSLFLVYPRPSSWLFVINGTQ